MEILEVQFTKLPGHKHAGPYITINLLKDDIAIPWLARIDTGADVTVIPKHLLPRDNGTRVVISPLVGGNKTLPTYSVTLTIPPLKRQFTLDSVLGIDSEYGLLGMDVISQLTLHMRGERCILSE